MADFDFTNLTIQECIEAKALLDNRLEELGGGKSYKSLEQKAMVLRQVKENFASFLSQYGITLTSDKVSSEWVEKFKGVIGKIISGDLTEFIDEDTTVIRPYAFYGIRKMESAVFLEATNIGNYAFGGPETNSTAPLLTEKALFPKATNIGDYAFQGSNVGDSLEKDFSSVKEIGNYAFCRARISVFDFTNITTIGNYAFKNCLFREIITDKDISLGKGAFASCYLYLEKIKMSRQKIIPDYCFSTGSESYSGKLTEVYIPEATEIGSYAFEYNAYIQNCSFDNVTKIGTSAFRECGKKNSVGQYEMSFASFKEATTGYVFAKCRHNIRMENLEILNTTSFFASYSGRFLFLYSLREIKGNNFGAYGSEIENLKEIFLPNLETGNSTMITYTKDVEMFWLPKLDIISGSIADKFSTNSSLKYVYTPLFSNSNTTSSIMRSNKLLEAINFGFAKFQSSSLSGNNSLKCIILMSTTPPSVDNRIGQPTSSYNPLYNCYRFFGTVNAEYNPNGDKDGYFYVPDEAVETFKTSTESGKNWSVIADRIKGHSEIPDEYKFLLTGEYNGEYKEDYEAYLLRKASEQSS